MTEGYTHVAVKADMRLQCILGESETYYLTRNSTMLGQRAAQTSPYVQTL